ncbi:MAG TPA: nucleotidyltransferase domain-containing protein [Fimbriimonadaceae bacterium]|nr:nucleotidyltransferase domain-containing protein [Fimbriimonadaceae bacterium]
MLSLSLEQKSVIRAVAASHGVERVRVFGSFARGDAKASSDLDLLVKFPAVSTLLAVIGFKQAVEEATGLAVDIVEEGTLSPSFSARVYAEAIPL